MNKKLYKEYEEQEQLLVKKMSLESLGNKWYSNPAYFRGVIDKDGNIDTFFCGRWTAVLISIIYTIIKLQCMCGYEEAEDKNIRNLIAKDVLRYFLKKEERNGKICE